MKTRLYWLRKAIETARSQNEKLLIQPIAICEMIWVFERAYGFKKSEILPVIDQLLRTAQFKIVAKDVCWQALADFSQKNGEFADYYIGKANERDGAEVTLTFDKALKESDVF
ncbi:MAG: PIN domain-containing protein [Desulfobacterales bacterium]|nr:MAG: PIN domain-containing protein [Desulfobacterales bacterium]